MIASVAAIERRCMQCARYVRISSDSFAKGVRALGVPDSKMPLIYDWVDTNLIRPLCRNTAFARENGLQEKFVVLYAGNLGMSQGLESVLDCAERLRTFPDIVFAFVGDGKARSHLMESAKERELSNARFLDYQPRERLPEILGMASASLVTLRKGVGLNSLPSKCFSILASGRPIIASVDEESETFQLVRRSGGGLCVPPEAPDRLSEAILRLRNDPALWEQSGRLGRDYALRHHSVRAATDEFERLMMAAIKPAQEAPTGLGKTEDVGS